MRRARISVESASWAELGGWVGSGGRKQAQGVSSRQGRPATRKGKPRTWMDHVECLAWNVSLARLLHDEENDDDNDDNDDDDEAMSTVFEGTFI